MSEKLDEILMNLNLSPVFWNIHRGLMLIGDDGSVRFTAAGRAKFAPLLARYGFALDNISTVERWVEVYGEVNAREMQSNTTQLEALLSDPSTTDEERDSIRRVLNI